MFDLPIEKCDVVDKENLMHFRSKSEEWLDLLHGDDLHAVWSQIRAMEWNHRVFLMINESRRISSDLDEKSSALNPLIAEFINKGYISYQALAIRKQLEPRAKDPAKQVISLHRVLEDIRNNREIITRECYVSADGLPFDYEPVKREYFSEFFERQQMEIRKNQGVMSGTWAEINGPKAWHASELRHKTFDRLASVQKNERSRDDNIRPGILDFFVSIIDRNKTPFKDVIKYSNKYIAHAADSVSIASLSNEERRITIGKIEECHKKIWQVTQYIISTILYGTYMVPGIIFQGNPLKHLDEPWIKSERLKELQKFWNTEDVSRDSWPEEFKQEIDARFGNCG